jgi:hypothetical protein
LRARSALPRGRWQRALPIRSILSDPGMPSSDLEHLHAEARHARDRFQLYRAKLYGSRAVSLTRLRDLERACEAAEARLRHAQAKA